MNPKIDNLQNILKKKRIDFALFYNLGQGFNPHLLYFLGYKGTGLLIIPASKKPFLIVSGMEFERAKKLKIKISKFIKGKTLSDSLKFELRKQNIKHKKIGIDETLTDLFFFKKLRKKIKARYIDVAEVISSIRAVKTKSEIRLYKKACGLTDKIFQKCLKQFNNFKTEKQVANFLEAEARKYNCSLSFEPIIASGKKSARPHFNPEEIPLSKGFCTIDFGIRYKDYCTDVTRTIYLGRPSKKEVSDYNLVLSTQIKTIDFLKPGISCAKIEKYARTLLGQKAKYFIHGLGHGIGINIHEAPNFKDASNEKLKEGMILTIEPGLYFFGRYGIRIEDDVLITRFKPVTLTRIKKELVVINRKP